MFRIFLVILFSASSLSAYEGYHGVWGGLSIIENRVENLDIDLELGPAVGLMYGLKCQNGMRLEVEGLFRRNVIDEIHVLGSFATVSGYIHSGSLYGNILYDFSPCGSVVPFVGAGAGWEYSTCRLNTSDYSFVEGVSSGFNMQLLGGLQFRHSEHLSYFVAGRYFLLDENAHSAIVSVGLIYNLY